MLQPEAVKLKRDAPGVDLVMIGHPTLEMFSCGGFLSRALGGRLEERWPWSCIPDTAAVKSGTFEDRKGRWE